MKAGADLDGHETSHLSAGNWLLIKETFMSAFSTVRRHVLASAILATALALPAWAADPVKLRFSSFEPPMAKLTSEVLVPFAKEVEQAADGTVEITMFAGGTLGRNPTQQLKLVLDGVADIAWIVLPYTPGRFDDADVVGLPFATENAVEGSLALQRMLDRGELRGFDDLKMLALAATSPVVIHGTVPINKPEDMQGKRARVSGDIPTRMVELLGAAPVQVGGGQIAEALSRGVVDLTLNNWGFVGDFKVDQVTKFHNNVPLGAVAIGVVMRKDKFDALPEQARAAFEQLGGEALSRRIGEALDEQHVEILERVSKSRRNTVVSPDADTLETWKAAVEPVIANWRQARPENEKLYTSFTQEVEKIRAGQ